MKKINIAIDGYSSCGKSTMAQMLAKKLRYIYIDTGAMYRAVTLFALQHGLVKTNHFDEEGLIAALDRMYITFKYNNESKQSEVHLNGVNVEKEIRTMQVSNYVSQVSDVKPVRDKLVKLQRRIAESKGVVMDGRDIGTAVLPMSAIKFFMTADKAVRAQRRFDELQAKGKDVSLTEVINNINMRDHIDTNRKHDPLRKAHDAIVIDNTHVTMEEQLEFALAKVQKILEENGVESQS